MSTGFSIVRFYLAGFLLEAFDFEEDLEDFWPSTISSIASICLLIVSSSEASEESMRCLAVRRVSGFLVADFGSRNPLVEPLRLLDPESFLISFYWAFY